MLKFNPKTHFMSLIVSHNALVHVHVDACKDKSPEHTLSEIAQISLNNPNGMYNFNITSQR